MPGCYDSTCDYCWPGDGSCQTCADSFEPNDSSSSAYLLPNPWDVLGSSCSGASDCPKPPPSTGNYVCYSGKCSIPQGWAPGYTISAMFPSTADNDDWYEFYNFDAWDWSFEITVRLEDIPVGTDYDIYLYDSSLTLLGSSENGGTTDELITHGGGLGDDSGWYYVWVSRWSGSSCDPYDLRITLSMCSIGIACD